MMFLLQLKYETLRLMRSPALWLLLFFLTTSVGFGLYNGSVRMANKQQSINEILKTQRTNFETQKLQADSIAKGLKTMGNWWQDPTNVVAIMWWGGKVVAIDPAPQSLLASGMSDLKPDAWNLTLTGKEAQGGSKLENPINLTFGSFDLAFVIAFLLPLLVISLSFNLISGEREQGTLPLQQAQPVAFRGLFIQKMLARFVLLTALTLLVSMPALAWFGVPLYSSAAWMTAGVAVLYSLFWFLMALGINLRGGSSAQNALLCIGVWLGFTLVVPALVNMLAQKTHPVPSRAGFQTALREIKSEVESNREKILDDYYIQHPNATRVSEDSLDWFDWNQCKNYYRDEYFISSIEKNRVDSLGQWYDEKAKLQANFVDKLALCSPTLSVYRQITDLAGTSRRAFDASIVSLDKIQEKWGTWFTEKFDADENLTVDDYKKFMELPEILTNENVSVQYIGMYLLILQCLLVGIWVWWGGQKS